MASFAELTADESKLQEILRGSHYHSTFADWTAARSFIIEALDGPGSILDIGCANGFLLKCLRHWSGLELTPYGIDRDEKLIVDARAMFPGWEPHFVTLSLQSLRQLAEFGLPTEFRYVYWNVWDTFRFDTDEQTNHLRNAASIVSGGGRLILGFYDREPESILAKIARAIELLGQPSGRIDNSPRREVVIWFQI